MYITVLAFQNALSFIYTFNSSYYPSTSFTSIVTIFRNINGTVTNNTSCIKTEDKLNRNNFYDYLAQLFVST